MLFEFFKYHPIQPYENVEFNPMKVYFRVENNKIFKSDWLNLCKKNKNWFCTFFLAFVKEENIFTLGCSVVSSNNPYTRIKEHEKSKEHESSYKAFLFYPNCVDIRARFQIGKQFEVERTRALFQRLI